MLVYFLLDTSQSVIFWIIKNLGYGMYYSIKYLFYGNVETEEEKEKKKTLEMLIVQKEDIETIKSYIETLKQQ
jgi:hypothetical protein